ncbi:MAG: Trk system potassium transporter TrkA [Candidatus Marinimicrobia bacterium]|nr:Trk system potassium transporter TrkA [Candidatus Neomarinimicrobiota bacterium]MBL7022684.1 Trk system potassium transporter TrkA [Candidatus Neomarinimicrobiota bacterium]MBL7110081.1 Trk system potassium transporter TrkA [Candidatus Neomarinimicrobiota bacterium]
MEKKVLIIGAGEVGYNLAKTLSGEDYEITIVDNDPKKCEYVGSTLDAKVFEGDGTSQRVLQQVNMEEIDILLGLTRVDEVNIVAARIGRKLGAKKIICRLRSTEYCHKDAVITPEQFGIDHVTYPERAAQREIERLIRQSSAVEIQEFSDGKIMMVGIKLEPSSPLIGRTVQNIELSNPFIHHKLVVVNRGESTFIPHQDIVYKKNDIVYFVGKAKDISKIQQMAGKPAIDVNSIIILGASKIGRLLARSLQKDFNVKLIEKDKDKAIEMGMKYPDTLVLNGSGTDIAFLESEGINETDIFIAVTDNEQTNILSAMLAKHLGAKQVFPHITTTSYLHAVRRIGVDVVVSKNISAVNEIINFIRSEKGKSYTVSRFDELDIEALELTAGLDSKYVRKKYGIHKIPENVSLGAIIRGDIIEIPNPHSVIQPNDKLLLFTKPSCVQKAENLFQ